MLPLIGLSPTDPNAKVVSPGVAANTIVGILGDAQVASGSSGQSVQGSGSGGQSHGSAIRKEPLGEFISVNLELAGLRDRTVLLSWSIFQKDGQTKLFGKWLSNFIAYRLEATTDDDTGTLALWVPLPKVPGPYFVRLSLTTDGAGLASADSGLFD